MATYSDDPDDNKMSLVEHLTELRQRLLYSVLAFIVAFFLCYAGAEHIYNFLITPLARIMHEVGGSQRMIYTALTEAFFTYVAVAAFGAAIITFPIIATQIWLFIAPGLYKHEKKALLPFLLASPVLFLMGAALVYYMVMPLAWRFLLGFQTTGAETVLPIQLEAKVGEYLGLVMKLILAFGMCFQMPVALTLMARVGMLSAKALANGRKYAIVGVFVLAAVVTPPDVISQIGLAVPLLLLYEASIWSCRLVERQRKRRMAEEGLEDYDDDDLDDEDPDDDGPDGNGPKNGGPKGAGPKGMPRNGSEAKGAPSGATPAPTSGPTSAAPAAAAAGVAPPSSAPQTPSAGDPGPSSAGAAKRAGALGDGKSDTVPDDEDDGPPETDFNSGR